MVRQSTVFCLTQFTDHILTSTGLEYVYVAGVGEKAVQNDWRVCENVRATFKIQQFIFYSCFHLTFKILFTLKMENI